MSAEMATDTGEAQAQRLERVYQQLAAVLGDPGTADRLRNRPAEEAWSTMQVLAHMGETLPYWMGNVRMIVEAPEAAPAHFGRSLDAPERHVGINRSQTENVGTLLAAYEKEVRAAAAALRRLSAADRARTGLYHGEQVKGVDEVIEMYVLSHAEAHLAQIKEALAS